MTSSYIGFGLSLWIVGNVLLIGVWDLYATLIAQDNMITVSYYLRAWARDFPVGVLAVGILLGHLIWPGGCVFYGTKTPVD